MMTGDAGSGLGGIAGVGGVAAAGAWPRFCPWIATGAVVPVSMTVTETKAAICVSVQIVFMNVSPLKVDSRILRI
jgi:hypothetical protein